MRPDFPGKTVQDLIAYAKANPGKLNYASQGVGTTSHLTAELFSSIAHIKLTHVPYKGTGPALNDIIASHVDLFFTELSTSTAAAQGRQGAHSRGRHQTARRRGPGHSDVGGGRRAGLRIRHLERDHRAAQDAGRHHRQAQRRRQQGDARRPTMLDRYKKLNAAPGGGTPAEMAAFIKQETERWSKVIQAAGIKPE